MHVEWQGDHRLLGDDVKQDFERELTRLGLDPSKFLVEVRREPDLPGADGLDAIRCHGCHTSHHVPGALARIV